MPNKIIPIVYSVNDAYAPYLYISLRSLVKHTGSVYDYYVYILYTNLEKRHVKRLEHLCTNHVWIKCADVSKNMKGIEIEGSNYLTVESCYRLLLPELFPQYSQVLYIDADTLIRSDVAELFERPLNGKPVGVVREAVTEHLKGYYQALGVDEAFNAGVLLIDMELFRKMDIGAQCLRLLIEDSKREDRRLQYMDQDALNVVLKDHVCFLDSKWNFLYRYLKNPDLLCNGYREEYLTASHDIKLIHYVSEIKPWEHPEYPMADLFWEEARKTPYYEEILFKGLRGRERQQNDLFKNHLFPFDRVPPNSRIALYGAGVVGRTLYAQNRIVNYVRIVLWVDRNHENITMAETIYGPEVLLEQMEAYDYVLIAIDDSIICASVESMLLEMGIAPEKIVWSEYGRRWG